MSFSWFPNISHDVLLKYISTEEFYQSMTWGIISPTKSFQKIAPSVVALSLLGAGTLGAAIGGASGALSLIQCHIGCTSDKLVFVCVSTWDFSRVKNVFEIPFKNIFKIKIRKSLIPGAYIIKIYLDKKTMVRFDVKNSSIFGPDQHSDVSKLIEILKCNSPR